MEHSQGMISVFVWVCEYVHVLNNVGLREFTHHSRGKGRTHYFYRGTHTKSSTTAIKSKAISLLLAIYTKRELTHACTHIHIHKTDKYHYQIQCETIRLLKKCRKKTMGGNEWHSNSTSSPNLNKICQQWEYKISEWDFFGMGDMERNQFQGQVWCQGRPEGHSSVDLFISICSFRQTENATVCYAASLRNIALITVP